MTTTTPGPWQWQGYSLRSVNLDPDASAVHTILTLEDAGCGFLSSDRDTTRVELAANHRLIAAAPALHAGLAGARLALLSALRAIDDALAAAEQGGTP